MARREVIEINCDRCKKVETQNKAEVRQSEAPEFIATFGGKTTTYEDLCRRCRETVKNYVDKMSLVKPDEELKTGDGPPKKMPNGMGKTSMT